MATSSINLPPLPEGFELNQESSSMPALPSGFELDSKSSSIESKEPSRLRSILSAAPKGFLKGAKESSESPIRTGPISDELGERLIEEVLPTQKKSLEKTLERTGRVGSYLVSPGKAISKLIRGGISVAGGQIAEELGLSKGAQSAVETGGLLTPTTLKGAQKYVNSLYNKAESLLPENVKVGARNLNKNLVSFIDKIKMGGTAPSKTPALTKAKEIRSKISKGQIDVKELTEFKKTINESRSGLYLDQALDKKGKALAKRNLDDISGIVDDALSEYGKKNPQWNKLYRSANEGHGAIANSKKFSNLIGKIIKQNPHASGAAIAATLIGHALSPKSLGIASIGLTGIKSGELIARISKSKVLRKYYQQAMQNAVKENAAGFLNNMKRIENHLLTHKEKEED